MYKNNCIEIIITQPYSKTPLLQMKFSNTKAQTKGWWNYCMVSCGLFWYVSISSNSSCNIDSSGDILGVILFVIRHSHFPILTAILILAHLMWLGYHVNVLVGCNSTKWLFATLLDPSVLFYWNNWNTVIEQIPWFFKNILIEQSRMFCDYRSFQSLWIIHD